MVPIQSIAIFLNNFMGNHMHKFRLVLLSVFFALTVAACGGDKNVRDDAKQYESEYDEGRDSSTSGIDTSRLNERGLRGVEGSDRDAFLDPNNPLSTRIIYFDFDSDTVRAEFMESLRAHAAYAKSNGSTVRLEGHSDERGTREYNVGLAERRAMSVRRILSLEGVPQNSLRTLSFGEERPAVIGHDESAWGQNRRVEIIYED